MGRILFLSISFKDRKGSIYNDLVDSLVERGHFVTVISSSENKNIERNNYRLIGFNKNVTGKANLIKKGIDTVLIGRKFKKIIKSKLVNESFDLIIYATPPITLNLPVQYSKKKFNAKTYLMLKDIFPQNAVDLQMFKKSSLIYKYFRHKEKQLYNLSDKIGCMSQGNIDYLLRHNKFISKDKVEIFYNSIHIEENKYISNSEKNNITTFFFGGNLGVPQNINGLLDIIFNFNDYNLAKFVIVGKGSKDQIIKDYIENNNPKNLTYKEFVPQNEYEELLVKADVGLISLDPRFTIPNIPSKLPTYMKLGKPVLAITDVNTDLKDIINEVNCGWWCDARNMNEIVNLIKEICENKENQIDKGKNGFDYLCEKFDVRINVKQLENFMKEV